MAQMNEAETRVEFIDPKLKESGWGDNTQKKGYMGTLLICS